MDNYCKPSKATTSEWKLRNILKSKKIPFYYNKVIQYTSCDCFTQDLIIGQNLPMEIDIYIQPIPKVIQFNLEAYAVLGY